MSSWYLDTTAALKLVLAEQESEALIEAITTESPTLVACYLLETDMRRAAHRSSRSGRSPNSWTASTSTR